MYRRLLALLAGIVCVSAAWAFEDWPQWKGPKRDGISTEKGLLDKWDEAPPLIWKSESIGGGFAGAVVEKGIVCTIGERDNRFFVSGVSDKDGTVIWSTEIVEKDVDKRTDRPYTASTPTMDGDLVYTLTKGGFLTCLKTATGDMVWQKSYKHDFGGVRPHFSYIESPLVDGDKIIINPLAKDGTMMALDKKTGKEIWCCQTTFRRKSGAGSCYASTVISYGAGIKQYVQFVGEGVIGVDAATGKELWHYTGVAGASNICTPLIRGDYVYIACGYYNGSALIMLEKTQDGGIEAKEIYHVPITKLRTESGGAVLVGDHLFQNHYSGSVSSPQCVEFMTGKMLWPHEKVGGGGSGQVIYAEGHVYISYHNGLVVMIEANPEKLVVKGQFRVPGKTTECWAHPSISNGRLYLRHHDNIFCYDIKKK